MNETLTQVVSAERTTHRQNSKLNIYGNRTKIFINGKEDTDTTSIRIIDTPTYASINRKITELIIINLDELKKLKEIIEHLIDFDADKPEEK